MNWRFIAAYVLLAVFGTVALGAFVIELVTLPHKADKSAVAAVKRQLNPTEAQIVAVACQSVVQDAASQGVIISSCHRLKDKRALEIKGAQAQVVVEAASVQTHAKYVVVVRLMKGAWSLVNTQVVGATQTPGP